ncbi:MAG: hypothetical protein ACFFBD_09980, partial [Candidatus Hodarchaeota archaeon]
MSNDRFNLWKDDKSPTYADFALVYLLRTSKEDAHPPQIPELITKYSFPSNQCPHIILRLN